MDCRSSSIFWWIRMATINSNNWCLVLPHQFRLVLWSVRRLWGFRRAKKVIVGKAQPSWLCSLQCITTCHFVAHPQKLFCFARHVRPRACGRGTSLCLYSDLPWVFYRRAGKLQQLHSDFVRNGKVCTRNPPHFFRMNCESRNPKCMSSFQCNRLR